MNDLKFKSLPNKAFFAVTLVELLTVRQTNIGRETARYARSKTNKKWTNRQTDRQIKNRGTKGRKVEIQ